MILYASATNGRRNLHQLQRLDFRLLYTPEAPNNWQQGWRYALDNGAWHAFQASQPWDEQAFRRAVKIHAACADFVCAPDVVADGKQSLALSMHWIPYLRRVSRRVLLVVQDGMRPEDLPALPADVGIAIGGSTEWKEQQLAQKIWRASWLHCLRCNTRRRLDLAAHAGCDSSDGTGASRFAKHAALMHSWNKQEALW